MVKQHNQLMLVLFVLAELLITAGAGMAAVAWCMVQWGYAHNDWGHAASVVVDLMIRPKPWGHPFEELPSVLAVWVVLTPLVFGRFGLYRPRRTLGLASEWWVIVRACTVVLAFVGAIGWVAMGGAYLMPELFWRFAVVWVVSIILFRSGVRIGLRWARGRGWNLRSAAVVGDGQTARALVDELARNPWTGIRVIFAVGDSGAADLGGPPVAGRVDELEKAFAREPVEVVFVALPSEQSGKLEAVLDALSGVVTEVCVVPELLGHFLGRRISQMGTLTIISLTHSPQEGPGGLAKRAFDVAASAALLIALCPWMLLIAAAIRLLDGSPVLYVQTRASLGGRPFRMLKFRSMVPGAEDRTGPVMAEADDPRVTRLGRLLRRTSLDELPQLLNVLAGHMSLVGPRPERPELIDQLRQEVPRYLLRNQVRAGLTGLAQVRGLRGRTSIRRRLEHDVYYINHWSLGLDLWILALTAVRVFRDPNAY